MGRARDVVTLLTAWTCAVPSDVGESPGSVVGEPEINQTSPVDGGDPGREAHLVLLDAAESDAPEAVSHEPRNRSFGHRSKGIFKTELRPNPAVLTDSGGHWEGLDDLEVATCAWVWWFNEERLHGVLDDRSPTEVEAEYSNLD